MVRASEKVENCCSSLMLLTSADQHCDVIFIYVSLMISFIDACMSINRFDISASGIGFDLNTRLLRPGLVESTCRAHMRSDWIANGHCRLMKYLVAWLYVSVLVFVFTNRSYPACITLFIGFRGWNSPEALACPLSQLWCHLYWFGFLIAYTISFPKM